MIAPSFSLTATERVLPRLALDFTTASLDGRITFTRSGATATRVNSSGLVEVMIADTPRFDFDPVTLACKGLLIEEARTNQATYSDDLANAAWTKTRSSISSNATTAPDGTSSADKLVEDSSTGTHFATSAAITLFSLTTHSASIYLKAGERTQATIRLATTTLWTGLVRPLCTVNLTTGAIVSQSATVISPKMENAGDGWWRLSFSATTVNTAAPSNIDVFLEAGNSYTGDGTSGIYVWGAQLEIGNGASSYIPTVASQVTRTADIATMTGTNFSDWYSAGVGGVVSAVLPSTVSGTRPALQFDDATANEVIALRGSATTPELVIVDGGAPQAQINAGTIAANTAYNLGAAWNTDNCAAAVNGGATVTDTSASIPTVTQARLGSDGTNYLNGHLQAVRYWPQRIINAEVQAFSK